MVKTILTKIGFRQSDGKKQDVNLKFSPTGIEKKYFMKEEKT